MLDLLVPGMVEEVEDEEVKRLFERFKRYVDESDSVISLLGNEEVIDLILQMRIAILADLERRKETIDFEEMLRELYDDFSGYPELLDILPYIKNYIEPILKFFMRIIKDGIKEGDLGIEEILSYFGNLENITYKGYLNMLFRHPMLSLICIFRGEICSSLADMILQSLKVEALLLIILLWIHGDIGHVRLFEAKEMFKLYSQRYSIAFERFRRTVLDEKPTLEWKWEGAITDDRSAVEVQHEVYRWRLEG